MKKNELSEEERRVGEKMRADGLTSSPKKSRGKGEVVMGSGNGRVNNLVRKRVVWSGLSC